MTRLLIYAILVSFCCSACEHMDQRPSLQPVLNKGHRLIAEDFERSILFADSLLHQTKVNGSPVELGQVYRLLATAQTSAGRLSEARINFEQALTLFEGAHDSLTIETLRALGVLSYYNGEWDTAITLSKKALDYYTVQSDHVQIAKTSANIGSFYKSVGMLQMGTMYLRNAIKYFNKIPNSQYDVAKMHSNLGTIYASLNRYELAKASFLRWYDVEHDSTDILGNSIFHVNIGNAYWKLDDLDSAKYHLQKSLQLSKKMGNHSIASRVYTEFGLINSLQEHHAKAQLYFEKAIEESADIQDPNLQRIHLINLARCHIELGELEEAEMLLKTPNYTNHEKNDALLKIALLEAKTSLHEGKKEFGAAYKYLSEQLVLNDSIKNAELNQQLDELNLQYEIKEKEGLIHNQKMTLASQEREHQALMTILLATFFILIILLVGGVMYQKHQNYQKSKSLISSQIELIKNQLSPHFLYNSLNILSSLIRTDGEKAKTAVAQLKKLYQRMLRSFGRDLVSVADELSILSAYFDLMAHRFGQSIRLNIDVKRKNDLKVVPFTFQMLAENAIKHNSISQGLTISILETKDYLLVENQINKSGRDDVISTQKGLKLLIRKYNLLGKSSPVIEQKHGKFIVKIPKIKVDT